MSESGTHQEQREEQEGGQVVDKSHNRWKASRDEDLAPAPEWAVERGSNDFRQVGAGNLCWEIHSGEIPPVLVKRSSLRPRHPAYVIPYALWRKICDLYPDMAPTESEMGEAVSARYFRDGVWRHILAPAYEDGLHSFAYSGGGKSWHVAFVPRLWMEQARHRMEQDGLLKR